MNTVYIGYIVYTYIFRLVCSFFLSFFLNISIYTGKISPTYRAYNGEFEFRYKALIMSTRELFFVGA